MAELIQLSAAREEKMPHSYGTAICLDCKHEWEAIVPSIGEVIWLECPKCSLVRGRLKFQHERKKLHWHCKCDNDLFHCTPDGIYCPNCGAWQYFPEDG